MVGRVRIEKEKTGATYSVIIYSRQENSREELQSITQGLTLSAAFDAAKVGVAALIVAPAVVREISVVTNIT